MKLLTIDIAKYDGFETGWNRIVEDKDNGDDAIYYDHIGPSLADVPDDDILNNPTHFICTVYGHLPEGGVESLCDCATQEVAEDFMILLDAARLELHVEEKD